MIMRYCPPYIFPHRCFLTRGENELAAKKISEKFGDGGSMPGLGDRWLRGQTGIGQLATMGIDKEATGIYYGFRTRDDQMLFYFQFEGLIRSPKKV